MNRAEAFDLLESGSQRERLGAARVLASIATDADIPRIKRVLHSERVPWIRSALERAAVRARSTSAHRPRPSTLPDELPDENSLAAEVYACAIEELTDQFVHELRPLLGLARVHAQREIIDFDASDTAQVLRQMQDLLRAIDTLGRAAAAPTVTDADVAAAIRAASRSCVDELRANGFAVREPFFDGPEPFYVATDSDLLALALRNGLKNALEASAGVDEPVVVSWGQSSAEYWISVLDYGDGLQADERALFAPGSTTKPDHLGMGLAIVERVVLTLGGRAALESSSDGTTRFELTLPRRSA